MEGLKRLVSRPTHRKELVAGGLAEYLTAGAHQIFYDSVGLADSYVEYRSLVNRLGDRASDFYSVYTNSFTYDALRPMRLLRLPLGELPQVRLWIGLCFTLGSQMLSDRLYPPGRSATFVDTGVSCFPSSRATSIKLIYGKCELSPNANGGHVRSMVGPEATV